MTDQIEKYHSRIYQLDELIIDVYNAIYVDPKSNNYKQEFIDVSNLKMDRFKLFDYDFDVIFSKTKIQFVDEFPTGMKDNGNDVKQIWFKRKGEIYMSTIRIVPYFDKETMNNMADPVNVHNIIKTLLAELVVSEKTNNILLPIINVDVAGTDLLSYEKIKPYVDSNKYYSLQITEKFYSLMTLDNFMKNYQLDIRVLRSIIYQATDILYQIGIVYPDFRYNQMFPETIDCYLKLIENIEIPELKLSDFYLSQIEELVPNNLIKSKTVDIPYIDSAYSDLYQLINYMWNNLSVDIKKYPELILLFDFILPKKIRSDGKYLTLELWNKLTEEEKFDLKIKNIRNSTFFTSKDSLLHTTFKPGESFSRISLDIPDITDDVSTERDEEIHTKNDILDDESENVLDDYSDTESISEDSQMDEFEPKRNSNESNQRITLMNKKYSNNDIDSMSHKKSKSNKRNNYQDVEIPYNDDEQSDERKTYDKPSRINPRNSNIGQKNKSKSYHGTRYLNPPDNSLLLRELNNDARRMNNNQNYYDNGLQQMNLNGIPSRINSIGEALGATPGDFNNANRNVDYNQIAQKMAQMNNPMPGQFPPNVPNPVPTNILNPMGQMGQMAQMGQNQVQQNDEYLNRYLAANQMQNQQQVDPNMLAYLMQQQQQNNQSMYPQQQMNGGGNKPFFFH